MPDSSAAAVMVSDSQAGVGTRRLSHPASFVAISAIFVLFAAASECAVAAVCRLPAGVGFSRPRR